MNTTLLRKHWMELRGTWALTMAMLSIVAIVLPYLPERQPRGSGVLSCRCSSTYSLFSRSQFFLLVLPVLASQRRRASVRIAEPIPRFFSHSPFRPVGGRPFFYRTGFGLLAIEGTAILGLAMLAVACAPLGGSMQVFTDGLPILLLMVPVYFLDSLLSIRLDSFSVVQIQINRRLGGFGLCCRTSWA